MRVVIAGGHGQIARHLEALLVARGDRAIGIVRNRDHRADLEGIGAEAVVLDLEHATVEEVAQPLDGADALVFAAGSGPGSGKERKLTVDRDGAILLADAAVAAGVRRYVIVSSMGAGTGSPGSDDVMEVYQWAKGQADDAVLDRDLDVTVVRPGRLTDEDATGRVRVGTSIDTGEIPRADVARVLVAVLDKPGLIDTTFEVVGGSDEIDHALDALG
jgi:uncharacterized protein YbjT (DUF2867 family)